MTRNLFDSINGHSFDDNKVERVKLHDLEMVLHYDTGKAVLVSDTGEESRAVWLPKSKIEMLAGSKQCSAIKKDGQRTVLPVITVTLPEWLAKQKGLI
jgi:hypothetical protein